MTEELVLESSVGYDAVDRTGVLSLPGLFQILQSGALQHADRYDMGTRAIVSRGESWVLNRMAATVHRYPRYEEPVRLVTWSAGIRAFKGYREFRLYAGAELLAAASSLWLYVSVATRSFLRVPEELAARFPCGTGATHYPDLDKLRFPALAGSALPPCAVTLRFSDIDGNGHVNHTAYFDFLQTALVAADRPPRPARLAIQFLKEITPAACAVQVHLEPQAAATAFTIAEPAGIFAQGRVG